MLIDDLNETLEGIVSRVLEGGDTEVVLDVPEDWTPGPSQLQLFFEQVIESPEPLSMPRVRSLSSKVRVRRGQYRGVAQLQVARHSVPVWGGPRALFYLMRQGFLYGSDSDARLAALLLGLGYHTPSCRSVMERSVWEMQLLRRLPEVESAPAAGRDKRHEGWIRYTVRAAHPLAWTPTGERLPDYSGLIERQIVRLSKKGDRELKPIKMPRKFEDAEAKIRGITDADRKIDAELRRLMACAEVFRTSPRVTQLRVASSLVTEGVEGIFSALADARDVWLEDDPIEVEREPMTPTLSTSVSEGEDLLLKWRPGVRSVLSVGRWYVLDWNGVLKPLSPDFPESMRPLLTEALPKIPSGDVARFLEVFARRCPLPLELDPGTVSGLDAAESVEKRLFLEEEDGGLKVGARFAYMLGEVCVEVDAEDRGTLLPLPGTGMIKRRADWEAEALSELGEAVGIALPARLEGDVAHDFLLDVLPVLSESWAVYGDRSLKQHQVQGSLAPEVVVGSGIDWFDVDVRFTVGDTRVGTGEILQSWLDGRRYHRLADGSVARLPDRWLARHGDALSELEELRKAAGGRLGAFAAPLAEALLAEAEELGDVTRWRRLIRDLTDFDGVGELASAAPLQATLRDYQVRGVRWLTFLRDAGLGGVLADDMGLGKTIQVLAALSDTHAGSRDRPSLVVAPASVVHNWALEAQRFAPWLEVHIHRGKTRRDSLPVGVDLIVTSYNLLRIDRELFESTPLRYAILDEAQHIKNPDSQVARAARALDASHRLALTGTPLENNLMDLWSLFHYAMPGFFGSKAAFRRRYAAPIQKDSDQETMRQLRARIRPFVLRRLKSEVATELPPRQEQVLYCDLGPAQRKLYESLRETYRSTVLDAVEDKGVRGSTLQILEALMRLRQACCDARLVPLDEARQVRQSAKLDLLFSTLERTVVAGHRTLIFSQWPSLLKLVGAGLDTRSMDYLYLDGSTRDRQSLVVRWNDPSGPPVFLISLKAGGSGLNLTGADHVVHLDPWWNPAVEAQATDRAHRIGQTRPVMAYKLVARDTVEEKILELQARKRQLMEAAVDADRMLVDTLTREDLEAVFKRPARARRSP